MFKFEIKLNKRKGIGGNFLDLYPESNYDPTEYERPCTTVDTCICRVKDSQLQVLLIRRKNEPFQGHWAIPGGFVDIRKHEASCDAALRELKEETGVEGIPVRQLGFYDDPQRDPRWRIVSMIYFALVSNTVIDKTTIEAADDAMEYGWFDLRNLPQNMAFDHAKILADLLAKICEEAIYKPLAMELVPPRFTWTELQEVYEVILNRKLLRSNFRRDIKADYLIEESEERTFNQKRGRPATLCEFKGVRPKYS